MLNQAPYHWTIGTLQKHIADGPIVQIKGGTYQPARFYGFFGLRSRIKLALAVFRGEADALFWPSQNPKAY